MTTLIHCYHHSRGYFDFVSSTISLSEKFPNYNITWAVPERRAITQVLQFPNTELFEVPSITFHNSMAEKPEINEQGYNKFQEQISLLQPATCIYVDFRKGRSLEYPEQFRPMVAIKPEISEQIRDSIIKTLGNRYEVIHVRTGDKELYKGEKTNLAKWYVAIEKYLATTSNPCCLISDSLTLKNNMRDKLHCSDVIPFHSGRSKNIEDAMPFAIDVVTIQNAFKCQAFSNPNHNTAFSRVPAHYAGVPYNNSYVMD